MNLTTSGAFYIYSLYFSIAKLLAIFTIVLALKLERKNTIITILSSLGLILYFFIFSFGDASFLPKNNDLIFVITEPIAVFMSGLYVHTISKKKIWACGYIGILGLVLYQLTFTVASTVQPPSMTYFSMEMLTTLPIYLFSYTALGYVIIRFSFSSRNIHVTKNHFILALFTFLPIDFFNHISFSKYEYDTTNTLLVISTTFAYMCCLLVLYGQQLISMQLNLAKENSIINEIISKKVQQYKVSTSNMNYLNKTVHDLMHNLSKLYTIEDYQERNAFLDELSSSLTIYNAFIETGNSALDTILTEKNFFCISNNIHFKCFIKDLSLEKMELTDVYTIFSGLLDAVISNFYKIEDSEKRFLSIHASTTGNLNTITITAFLENNTISKNDYDVKSAICAVEKYNGNLSIEYKDSLCVINIIIPS